MLSTDGVWAKFKQTDPNSMQQTQWSNNGSVIWLTGLSASGKSTLAHALQRILSQRKMHAYVLDGDNIRCGLSSDLDFSPEGRVENIRRVSEMAALMADAGVITIVALISPYRIDRGRARKIITDSGSRFIEIYVNAPLSVCEERDPKNLYKKARAGEIQQFTGIDAPYEEPENCELILHTNIETIEESISRIIAGYFP
ncbi:MAG: adenylyl-sulfate kinase [Chthoniobacterales bacterium]